MTLIRLEGAFPRALLLGSLLALGPQAYAAVTLYVNAVSPCPGSGTQGAPFCTIQGAICVAVPGDLVSVAPGTYHESIRMRPEVSLISTGGRAVTTIDGTGKPCTIGLSEPPNPGVDFCTPVPGSTQCSTVVFGDGFTNADRIDGFTIRGGKGINRTAEGFISGGGIFALSEPTISNNLITANILQGPEVYYAGGGIYLNSATPASAIITRNTIDGNRAVPVAGTVDAIHFGFGGGIYSGFKAHPTISNNIINANRASDTKVLYTLGYGGGISTNADGPPSVVITSNVISGNSARTDGGGVYMGLLHGAIFPPVVKLTSNEIRGNSAGRRGGGVSTYYTVATIVNNTVVSNAAVNGGGFYVSRGQPTHYVLISNNLISANTATEKTRGGGGIYVSASYPRAPLTVRSNDFFNNAPKTKQAGGAITDLDVIGVNGNLKIDPRFVSSRTRNYHLAATSPVIDAGRNDDSAEVTADADGSQRFQERTSSCPPLVDMGAYEAAAIDEDSDGIASCEDLCPHDASNDQDGDGVCGGAGFHAPKTGDLDNCLSTANTGQENADGDGSGDACDLCPGDPANDEDGDGVCAGSGFAAPKTADHDNCPKIVNVSQVDVDADGSGDPCDFTLIAPSDLAVFTAAGVPPIFTWYAGPSTVFQVQFSASASPFTPTLVSLRAFRKGTSLKTSKALWKKIAALAPSGTPIYWRVVGKPDMRSTVIATSDQTYSLTVTP